MGIATRSVLPRPPSGPAHLADPLRSTGSASKTERLLTCPVRALCISGRAWTGGKARIESDTGPLLYDTPLESGASVLASRI